MKNKGFTLIELIAVVIVMGMILLIVFPATSRLLRDNEEKEYKNYYDIVVEGLEQYARTRRDDIGGSSGRGCIDTVSDYSFGIKDLIANDYIKEYDLDKDSKDAGKKYKDADNYEGVICRTPQEFVAAELIDAGIDMTKQYVGMKIENNEGKIKTELSMICKKKGSNKIEYQKLIEKTEPCQRYVADIQSSLFKKVEGNIVATEHDNDDYYVSGTAANNYVWYSGKMWRITGYNKNNRTIKLITDENITMRPYNTTSNFYSSNIRDWLNNTFLNTLKNSSKYLEKTLWNYTTITSNNPTKPSLSSTQEDYVGLLNFYEYSKTGGFLNNGQKYWLLSKYNETNQVWYVNQTQAGRTEVTSFIGVRPSIVLKSNVTVLSGGDGTINNPFILTGDTSANAGTYLNTRYAGEYVKFNGADFRILETNASYTKLISEEEIATGIEFHYFDKKYTSNTFISAAIATWLGTSSTMLSSDGADFCEQKIGDDLQIPPCTIEDKIRLSYGIPALGEMFTANMRSGLEYWTMTNAKDVVVDPETEEISARIYAVKSADTTLLTKEIEDTSNIRAVVVIKNSAIITGGSGTKNSPYEIQ